VSLPVFWFVSPLFFESRPATFPRWPPSPPVTATLTSGRLFLGRFFLKTHKFPFLRILTRPAFRRPQRGSQVSTGSGRPFTFRLCVCSTPQGVPPAQGSTTTVLGCCTVAIDTPVKFPCFFECPSVFLLPLCPWLQAPQLSVPCCPAQR